MGQPVFTPALDKACRNSIKVTLRSAWNFQGDSHSISNDFAGFQITAQTAHMQRELEHFRDALCGLHRVQHQFVSPERGADF